jgi:phosphoserine phosphatase
MRDILTIVSSDSGSINNNLLTELKQMLAIDDVNLIAINEGKAYHFYHEQISRETQNLIEKKLSDQFIDGFFYDESFRKKKKLFMSDMDATLIKNECIDEIARHIGKYDEIATITNEAMNGDMLFENSLTKRVSLLEGVDVTDLAQIYDETIEINAGVKQTAKTLKENGVWLVIVSGGFTYFCDRVAKDCGFDEFFANKLITDQNLLTGKVQAPVFSSESKLETLEMLVAKQSLALDEVIAIGDGANDLPFLKKVPFSIGYKAKPIVKENVKFNIVHSDFRSILYILGIEF